MSTYDFIPSEIEDRLLYLRDQLSSSIWEIGDIANSLIEAHAENEALGRMFIYSAVGMFVGKASRTIREYARVSRRFDSEYRIKYAELTFDHFRVCQRLGDRCDEALEWAVTEGAITRPATVDMIVAKFAIDEKEIDDDYISMLGNKADEFMACLVPLLQTPLKEKAQMLRSMVVDFVECCEYELEKI